MTASGEFTRRSLGRRLAEELDKRQERGDLTWKVVDLIYVVDRGPDYTLRMTPGECADWLGLPLLDDGRPSPEATPGTRACVRP